MDLEKAIADLKASREHIDEIVSLELTRVPMQEERIAELNAKRLQIEQAILSLERLAQGRGRKRGRPPAWMAEVSAPQRRGRPPGSKNKPWPTDPNPPLPPGAAMPVPRPLNDLVWAVSGRKRPAC
jgi:hypothetical protein